MDKIVYISHKNCIFGFLNEVPAICAQGDTKEIVREKIIKYYRSYEKRKYS